MRCLPSELTGLGRKETCSICRAGKERLCSPLAPGFLLPACWPPHLCTPRLFLVCGTSHLSASPVLHLVWKPGRLAWKHHHLEAICRLPHLPHHALPLSWLLAGAQVPGTENKINNICHFLSTCFLPGPGQGTLGIFPLSNLR